MTHLSTAGFGDATGLETNSIDMVTIGQALHWFEMPALYTEMLRVLKPGGVFTAFGDACCRAST
jgi:ubiquinone/menaquinone biosynthesis C-methylase UbiE